MRQWIDGLKARGFGGAARTTLDALGAMGPLAAQLIYVGQPVLNIFSRDVPLEALARQLEHPDGVEQLRVWLDEN